MNKKHENNWLDWAIQIEEQSNCDIEAGLDIGQHLGDYLAKSQNYLNRDKLMLLLREDLGGILSQEELEEMANEIQNVARNPVIEKLHSPEVA